ncbi:MAG: S8 family serine peptidase [Pseudomonas sp.]|uniref:S8 family peptidase n=1 Tax=Pseudomonas abieticivorans TaxID=2931382 RepID=UPI0020BDA60B|nr:S8 family serine peptidase [Pseudomonas sp. PIA16]MDE1169059.1 S8 family serine peptidase [Pseudomonas sp.]
MKDYIVLRRSVATPARGLFGKAGASSVEGQQINLAVERIPDKAVAELQADPEVQVLAPKMPISLIRPAASGAGEAGSAWGLAAVGANDTPYTGAGVTVAVLDTGIEAKHPAFEGVELIQKDFSGDGNGDTDGHGTHCAGTIFGRGNPVRIGVAPGIKQALIGKVLQNDGDGTSDMVFDGLLWAYHMKADIISLSLGFDFPGMVKAMTSSGWPVELATSNALEAYRGNLRMFDAIMGLLKARAAFGVCPLVVAAAGNESRRQVDGKFCIAASLPAAADDVLSVAAVGREGDRFKVADFSNTLPSVCAPGVDILSARRGGTFTTLSGTSMACPHVAGVAALWWEAITRTGKKANASNVRAKLIAHARVDLFAGQGDESDIGQGVVMAPRG